MEDNYEIDDKVESDDEEEDYDYYNDDLSDEDEEIEDDDDTLTFTEKTNQFYNQSREIKIVPPSERITDNRLHKNELSFILSTRAKQIAKYSTHFLGQHIFTDPITIAYHELYTKKCPLKLRRQIGVTHDHSIIVEEWDVNEMVLPPVKPPGSNI